MNKKEKEREVRRLQLLGQTQLLKDDSAAALQTIKKGEAIKRGVVPPRVVSGGGGMLATAGQDATALYIGTGARAKDYRDLVAARKRITPAGAGGGGGGGSHSSSAGYYTNRQVHGDRGPGIVGILRDAGNAATAAVAGAGAAASHAIKGVTKRLKGNKKSYPTEVREIIPHLEKARADAKAMKLLNDFKKTIASGLADGKAGRNVNRAELAQMLTYAEQLEQDLYGAKTVDLGGGRRKSRKRRRRKRRKTRRRKRRRHTRRRRKSKRRKSRKKR